MIVQNVSKDGTTDLTFTVPRSDLKRALAIVETHANQIGAKEIESSENIAKVSVIGIGMRSHAGIASKMFTTLAKENINIQMISTSEIKISIIVDEKYTELAVRVLHDAFELGK
jgi:aspartate kinase